MARIDGARLNIADEAEAVSRIIADAVAGRGATVFSLDLDRLLAMETDPAVRAAYERATYVTAGTAPVVALARGEGAEVERVDGADLVLPLARAAAMVRVPLFLVGTEAAALAAARRRLRREAPGVIVAGTRVVGRRFDPHGGEARATVAAVAASGARICLVALETPVQEPFANAALCRSEGIVFVGVGESLSRFADGGLLSAGLSAADLPRLARRAAAAPRRAARALRSSLYLVRLVAGKALTGG